jgi:hypothetical protein
MSIDPNSAFLEALEKVGLAPPRTPDPTTVDETVSKDREEGTSHVPDPGGVTLSNLWRHPDAHPIVLDMLLIQKLGPEWMLLEPETLQIAVPEEFKTQALSDLNLSKIMACKTLHAVDSFWERWEVFTWVAMPLNGEFPDFDMMQVPTIAQALVAVDCANRIREGVKWSAEVEAYLQVLHKHEGVLVPIPPLDFVKVEGDFGINLEDVRKRWTEVRRTGVAPTGGSPEDEQIRRLLEAHTFLEESRSRLRAQLAMVNHAHV